MKTNLLAVLVVGRFCQWKLHSSACEELWDEGPIEMGGACPSQAQEAGIIILYFLKPRISTLLIPNFWHQSSEHFFQTIVPNLLVSQFDGFSHTPDFYILLYQRNRDLADVAKGLMSFLFPFLNLLSRLGWMITFIFILLFFWLQSSTKKLTKVKSQCSFKLWCHKTQ